jgi:parallel beta-helix repeat protein
LTSATVNSNTGGGNTYGCGLYANDAVVTITGGTFNSNTGGTNRGGGGIALLSSVSTSSSITGTTINSNETGSYGGGGIYIYGSTSSVAIDMVEIRGNTATGGGGGIYVSGSATATVTNTLVSGNRFTNAYNPNYGGGIRSDGTLNLYYSTVVNNYGFKGGGISCGGTETIRNSIIYNNTAGDSYDDIMPTCETDDNNVTADPTFVDYGTQATISASYTDGDYQLDTGSICIDNGNENGIAYDYDIDGNPRPDISNKDIGAYEKQ